MKTIKFRGMDANGVMRYGRLSQDKPNETVYYKEYSQRICWDDSSIPVSNISLGQFTGILDKNDNEVYEGDIVRYDTEDGIVIATIDFEENSDEGKWVSGFIFKPLGIDEYEKNEPIELEVIGNIHSNPELLGGTK